MINARIYNYSNLKDEDKRIIDAQLSMIKAVYNIKEDIEPEEPSFLEKILYDVGLFILTSVQNQLFMKMIQTIVKIIDEYDQAVEEIDTDDYLFGLLQENIKL